VRVRPDESRRPSQAAVVVVVGADGGEEDDVSLRRQLDEQRDEIGLRKVRVQQIDALRVALELGVRAVHEPVACLHGHGIHPTS
jgi:hypothetical protein